MCDWLSNRIKVRKNGQQKNATCHVTRLQNKLNSGVARFTSPIKPVLQQIRFFTGLKVASKTRNNSIFELFCSNVANKLHVFVARFTEAYYKQYCAKRKLINNACKQLI